MQLFQCLVIEEVFVVFVCQCQTSHSRARLPGTTPSWPSLAASNWKWLFISWTLLCGRWWSISFFDSHHSNVSINGLTHWFYLQIKGTEKPSCRELHIAYRYGDHYDSVRKIGDNSETPAHLCIEVCPAKQTSVTYMNQSDIFWRQVSFFLRIESE